MQIFQPFLKSILLLKMRFNASSWSVKKDFNKAKLRLEIPNFSEVLSNSKKGQEIRSKEFEVGGSKFAFAIYPKGGTAAKEGWFSALLWNEGNHDVEVNYTIVVEGGHSTSSENSRIEKEMCTGRLNFMRASDVGTDLNITVEVTLKWEEISGEMVESSDLVKVEERLGEKVRKLGQKMKQSEDSLAQTMEKKVRDSEERMEEKIKKIVRAEVAKSRMPLFPECPVCFDKLSPPKKIVQCLKAGVYNYLINSLLSTSIFICCKQSSFFYGIIWVFFLNAGPLH